MIRLAAVLLLVARTAAAQTPEPSPPTADDHLARVRELYDRGDFTHARDELRAAYQLDPRPELLFALGQVELNLNNFQVAIRYYEQFIATGPAAEQIALAQQAIGAARAKLAIPPPPPPPPPRRRHWDAVDTVLAAAGGAAVLAGAGLIAYGDHLGNDHSGPLSRYERRVDRANRAQWIGAGCIAGGAVAVATAVLRWRLHLVDGEIAPIATASTAGVSWMRTW